MFEELERYFNLNVFEPLRDFRNLQKNLGIFFVKTKKLATKNCIFISIEKHDFSMILDLKQEHIDGFTKENSW